MAGASIRVDDRAIADSLARLQGLLARPQALWDEIGLTLARTTRRRFEREAGPSGAAWPPSERARLRGGRTLRKTGRLWRSITHVADDEGAEIGTNVVYAAIHQFGGTIEHPGGKVTTRRRAYKRGGFSARFVKAGKNTVSQEHQVGPYKIAMPARPFLGIDDADRDLVRGIVSRHLARAIAGRQG